MNSELPRYKHENRSSKYGKKTKTYSFKLPIETIGKIRKRKVDVGQMVYDVIEKDVDPRLFVGTKDNDNEATKVTKSLLEKLVVTFVEQREKIEFPNELLTSEEKTLMRRVAQEVLK